MKKFIVLLLLSFCSFVSFAQDTTPAVTMEGYSQSWLDYEGTIRLRNNTQEKVNDVCFVLSYYDMKGNMLDYKEFCKKIEIEPGMTKALDIESFEHDRNASYYKSEAMYGQPYKFDVKYELKGYNVKGSQDETEEIDELFQDNRLGTGEGLMIGSIVILAIGLVILRIGLNFIPAIMAKKRNRNPILWFLLGLFIGPILTIILLLILGYDNPQDEHYAR